MEQIRSLAHIVFDSVRTLEENCYARNINIPDLSTPFDPDHEKVISSDPQFLKAQADIIAAAGQLVALVQSPQLYLITISLQFHLCSALRYVTEVNVVEILREAGPRGMPIQRIAELAKTNENKLNRALRFLATKYIFQEVVPDVYANNRLSLILDSGKNVASLEGADPIKKFVGSNCTGALFQFSCDHTYKASAYLTDNLLDPKTRDSFRADQASFTTAYRTDKPYWAWLEEPGNEHELQLFGLAMEGMSTVFNRDSGAGFDWKSVKAGGVVVDVGGGFGSQTMVVARQNPHLKFVVQDRELVIEQARDVWKKQHPEAISSGFVTLQPNDFFSAQPITNASVYFLRFILHDWCDADCRRILSTLRASAQPDTQLLIIDKIVPHACEDDNDMGSERPPRPLLPNGGLASLITYELDFQMMACVNGQERTLDHLDRLLASCGWRLQKVFKTPYFVEEMDQAVAVPALNQA